MNWLMAVEASRASIRLSSALYAWITSSSCGYYADTATHCLQEAEVVPAEGKAATQEAEQGPAAEESTMGNGADADWDIMKLLPSSLGPPTTAGDAAAEVRPVDTEVTSWLTCLTIRSTAESVGKTPSCPRIHSRGCPLLAQGHRAYTVCMYTCHALSP